MHDFGVSLLVRGRAADAEPWLGKAQSIREQALGRDDPATLETRVARGVAVVEARGAGARAESEPIETSGAADGRVSEADAEAAQADARAAFAVLRALPYMESRVRVSSALLARLDGATAGGGER
jgi:hypothetical protein